jgi:hypothetical protein
LYCVLTQVSKDQTQNHSTITNAQDLTSNAPQISLERTNISEPNRNRHILQHEEVDDSTDEDDRFLVANLPLSSSDSSSESDDDIDEYENANQTSKQSRQIPTESLPDEQLFSEVAVEEADQNNHKPKDFLLEMKPLYDGAEMTTLEAYLILITFFKKEHCSRVRFSGLNIRTYLLFRKHKIVSYHYYKRYYPVIQHIICGKATMLWKNF